ncbi:MAG: transposase [Deltaproteobacteria bacterium]|uniref:Transposase n=1 Tax=Candidatus Desulfacyla euxinica TaxID=2841693 RepID=A0A8J6N4L6_9DELT|nr:transposase [Candidatus Desulfacyla euxinica]
MPRSARLDAPGVLHHVMIRGIERKKIFRDSTDQDDFLSRLEDLIPKTNMSCYAWALLSNHAHFLLRTGDTPLTTFMRRLLTGYAGRFNRRHKRNGPLFQNRFKSILCQEDEYLKELVRYIHLNPLRANIVSNTEDLNNYRYCGHSALMGKKGFEWQETGYVLSYFGKRVSNARKLYCEYVKEGIRLGRRPELVGGGLIRSLGGWDAIKKSSLKSIGRVKGDDRILGDSEFVLQVLKEADEKFDRHYELKQLGYNLQGVEKRVCKMFDLSVGDIYSKSREKAKTQARSLFCYWSVRELGYSMLEIARRLGISQPGVVYAVRRGERIAKERDVKLTH